MDIVRPTSGNPASVDPDAPAQESAPKKPKKTKEKSEPAEKREQLPFRSILKSKVFLGSLSLALACALAFGFVPFLQYQMSQEVPIVVLAQDLPVGTRIEAYMLETRTLPVAHFPTGGIGAPADAVGMHLTVAALSGDYLTARRITTQPPGEHPELTLLPADKLAMSVMLSDLAHSLSGKLRAGDVIQLFAVVEHSESGDGYTVTAVPELRCVEVLSVTNSAVYDIVSGEEVEDRRVATVVLAVNEAQAEILAGLNQFAVLHAALVTRGDDEAKATALSRQEAVFKEGGTP